MRSLGLVFLHGLCCFEALGGGCWVVGISYPSATLDRSLEPLGSCVGFASLALLCVALFDVLRFASLALICLALLSFAYPRFAQLCFA